jgi:Ca-activated chloride channel family protein
MRWGCMPTRLKTGALGLLLVATIAPLAGQDQQALPAAMPTFKSGVDMVTVTAVVRDAKGRLVPALTRDLFEVFDGGERRAIAEFRPDEAPVTVAILFDASGSMGVASKSEAAKRAASDVLAWLYVGRDEYALYAFDTHLEELQRFSSSAGDLRRSLEGVESFGMTSLYDAIAETARLVAGRGGSHRAVVVLTDGVDTSSRLTASQVSGIASSIDVPVYILAVVSPLDHEALADTVVAARQAGSAGDLASLAVWTGGGFFVSSKAADSMKAAQEIVSELRHQYLLAFEPGSRPGWHPVEVRMRGGKLTVRARSGYFAGRSQ